MAARLYLPLSELGRLKHQILSGRYNGKPSCAAILYNVPDSVKLIIIN